MLAYTGTGLAFVRSGPNYGESTIFGTTQLDGTPGPAKVVLKNQRTGSLVQTLYTDDTGAFRFDGISNNPREWAVFAVSLDGTKFPAIASHVTAV